ncbi:MAG TPA: response regulator [Kofleriaceae bacterium]
MGRVLPFRLRTDLGVVNPPPVIVIADRDAETRETVRGFMSARGYRVEPASDVDTAAGLLRSRNIDVLITELALRGPDGTDLLSLAHASAPATRRIAIAADATVRERDAALRLGVVRVLAKPLSLLELADAIGLAHDCAEGLHGWMHRMSLVDVLQMYHHAGQSLVIHVNGDVEGAIALRHGELIHAECHGRVGMPALVELLTVQRGQLETTALDHASRTITGPFDHVLLDGLRSLDEVRRPAGPAAAPAAADDWLDDSAMRGAPDREALQRWLGEHAPDAGAWQIDPVALTIERIDPLGPHPERELAGPPNSLGWACELAELADPAWTRAELLAGDCAIAVFRVSTVVIAFARVVAGDAMLRRFQVESARLMRWLTEHPGSAP